MRQFILAQSVAANDAKIESLDNGVLGFLAEGKDVCTTDGTSLKGACTMVLGNSDGMNTVLGLHSNKFSYVKSSYVAPTKYKATFTVTQPKVVGDYTVIIVKKGVLFNERNKWTSNVYVTDTTMTAAKLAEKLVKSINNMSSSSGVNATASSGAVTINGVVDGVDYAVYVTDNLSGLAVTETAATIAKNDAKAIIDLYNKCAADKGINYTYKDDASELYPNFPFNPLKGVESSDTGFDVYTLRFAEPRVIKTTDEVVNQVVHVAFPTTKGTAIEDILDNIGKQSVESAE